MNNIPSSSLSPTQAISQPPSQNTYVVKLTFTIQGRLYDIPHTLTAESNVEATQKARQWIFGDKNNENKKIETFDNNIPNEDLKDACAAAVKQGKFNWDLRRITNPAKPKTPDNWQNVAIHY